MTTQETTAPGRIPIEPYTTHSRRLMEHAEEQLANGDRLQASEKAWGTVAHQIKAIADRRGWEYEKHAQLFPIMKRLANETEDPAKVKNLFDVARGMHDNFYADLTPLSYIEDQIGRVKELLDILNRPSLMTPEPNRINE